MLENLRISFQGIRGHRMRSFLTMLGIIIGIGAIICIVSIIQGSNEQLKKNLIGSGTNSVTITFGESADYAYDMSWSAIPDGIPVLDEDTRDQLAEIDHAEDASLYRSRSGVSSIFYNSKALTSATLIGTDMHYLRSKGLIVSSGREFVNTDFTKFRKVALIDDIVSRNLFMNEDPIGKTLDIYGEPFIIVGTVEEAADSGITINSVDDWYNYSGEDESSGTVIVPDVTWPMILQYDEPQNAVVLADDTETMTSVGKDAAELLNNNVTSKTMKYYADDITQTAEDTETFKNTTNTMLLLVASISLLVGGIGVMNIMLVSVTERTREIGLKKAIGAKRKVILAQFLTEAALLTSLGGILGVLGGIVASETIAKIWSTPVAISIPAIIGSIAFSTAIGLAAGFLPARKAANLDPIIALRHE